MNTTAPKYGKEGPIFSRRYTVSAESEVIDAFLTDFNVQFDKFLKSSVHIMLTTESCIFFKNVITF